MNSNDINTKNISHLAAYQVSMAARYLRMPSATLAHWLKKSQLLKPPESRFTQLSFINLVEAYVLSSLRRFHKLSMHNIKRAIEELQSNYPEYGDHPLATVQFFTDGKHLMIEALDNLINLSKGSQIEIREAIDIYLHRIETDETGPVRLYPYTIDPHVNKARANRKPVLISPHVSFGYPSASGVGVATEVIFNRFTAGDTQAELIEDYSLSPVDLEEILRYEATIRSAA